MKVVQTPYLITEHNKHIGKILKHENYEIINIQLRTGETIPEHHAAGEVLIIVRSGIVSFTVEGKKETLSAEKILHMNPFENHSVESIENTDLLVIKFK